MKHLFEREFLEISNGIAKDIKEIGQDWKFSILGTPLISSQEKERGNLSQERIIMLNNIGFDWNRKQS